MYNWAGRFNILCVLLLLTTVARADAFPISRDVSWSQFEDDVREQTRRDKVNGISYIISGSLAFGGGLIGSGVADDEIEKGIYSVFQTIGVASAGYGLYLWSIGGYERDLHSLLSQTRGLSELEKTMILRTYYRHKREKERKERLIKAITHGLIAGLNIYSATQQDDKDLRTVLYFVGGVNFLAAASFTF